MIDDAGRRHGVDPALIKGFIQIESAWDVNASRYEPHIKDSSWGLMQVLLKTGKWMLQNDNLTISQLVTPKNNVEAGVRYIKYQLNRYKGNVKDAIAAYNAGSVRKKKDGTYVNQSYVDKVYRQYQRYKAEPVPAMAEASGVDPILVAAFGLAVGAVALVLT